MDGIGCGEIASIACIFYVVLSRKLVSSLCFMDIIR